MRSVPLLLLGALSLLTVPPAHAAPAGGAYQVVARWQPGGEGGWDYLTMDAPGHRLFVSRGTHMQVLDAESGKLLGDIPDLPGVHGAALAPDLGQGFTSNGRDSSVTVFDLKTLATVKKIKIPARNPDAILYEPVTKRVFTFNGGSRNVTAIDAVSGEVVGTIDVNAKPEFAQADGKGRVFVNLEDSSAVVAFDAKTLAITSRWPLAPGEEPSGLALDREHGRLFSVCGNQHMIVLDVASGKIVADVPIGRGVDAASYDPATGLAFASNGEGHLTVVHEDSPSKFTKLEDVPTQRGARTMTLDPTTHRLYTVSAEFGEAPAPTPENPRPRPRMVPGSFVVLVLERK